MKKRIFITAIIVFIGVSYICAGDNKTIQIGNTTFCVPKHYNILDQSTGPAFTIKGADIDSDGGSFQASITLHEVKQNIPAYLLKHGDLRAPFIVNISQSPTGNKKWAFSNEYYAYVLQLTDSYENAHVQYAEQYDFYRVSDWGFPPPFVLWEVLKIKPEKKANIPQHLDDYYIATCSNAGGTTGINGNSSSCDFSANIEGYLVEIHTTENNLHLKDKLIEYTRQLLNTWKKNCE